MSESEIRAAIAAAKTRSIHVSFDLEGWRQDNLMMSESEIARATRLQDQRNEAMADALRDRVNAPAREAAHDAYHAHNETCSCREVGCLTKYIADAVLDALAGDVARLSEAPAAYHEWSVSLERGASVKVRLHDDWGAAMLEVDCVEVPISAGQLRSLAFAAVRAAEHLRATVEPL